MNREEIEAVLAQTDFVRSLARSLVLDENRADDISQQAFLAALESRLPVERPLGAWFSGVVKNLAKLGFRSDMRRRKRERLAARPDGDSSAADEAELKEVRRTMVEAVLELEEPYHSAIELRYFGELTTREVADKLNIPVETVRTRLKRGLAKLRQKLDKEFGDRGAWCLALAPLAGLEMGVKAATAGVAASTVSTVSGGILMATKVKVGIAAVVVLCAAVVLWQFTVRDDENSETLHQDVSDSALLDSEERSGVTSSGDEFAGVEQSADSGFGQDDPEQIAQRDEIQPEGVLFAGRVVDSSTGEPITAYHFRLCRRRPHLKEDVLFSDVIRDEEGRFSFRLDGEGDYPYEVRTSEYLCRKFWVSLPNDTELDKYEIALNRGEIVKGRVIEAATGRPVEGAIIGIARWSRDTMAERAPAGWDRFEFTELTEILDGHDLKRVHGRSDASGRFLLSGLIPIEMRVVAIHPEYAEGYVVADPSNSGEVEIRMKKGYRAFGTVFDDYGNPAEGIRIWIWGDGTYISRPVLSDKNGKYLTAPVNPGDTTLYAGAEAETAKVVAFTNEWKSTNIIDQDIEINFGPVPGYATLAGTVVDYDDTPVNRCYISLQLTEKLDRTEELNRRPCAYSDDEGRFKIRKLVPGTYSVKVNPGNQGQYAWGKVTLSEAELFEHEIDLAATGGAIRGVVFDGMTMRPPLDDRHGVSVFAGKMTDLGSGSEINVPVNSKDGSFCIRGLPEGQYTVIATGWNCNSRLYQGVNVKQGMITDGMRIEVLFQGELELSLLGFKPNEVENVDGYFLASQGVQFPYDVAKKSSQTHKLPPGEWTLRLWAEGIGSCSKAFSLKPRKKTHLTIYRTDLVEGMGKVSIEGRLYQTGEREVDGTEVVLRADKRLENRKWTAVVNQDGSFVFDEIETGPWSVRVQNEKEGINLNYEDILIPFDANDPFPLVLTIPSTTFTGVLCDESTGNPVSIEFARWKVTASSESKGGWHTAGSLSGEGASRFSFSGLPKGTYRLWIECEGFEARNWSSVELREGSDIDIGEIYLKPVGILDLEVVDDKGEPVSIAQVSYGNDYQTDRSGPRGRFELGKFRFSGLPTGQLTVRVSSPKCRSKEIEVVLLPGEPVSLKVELD